MRVSAFYTLAVGLAVATAGYSTETRPELAVTVYNQNLALVRQLRTIELKQGIQTYSYEGIAAQIDPTSVHFVTEGVAVLEQNFEYDLVDRNALMEKYLGKNVEVQLEGETVRGRLLSTSGGAILEERSGQVRSIQSGAILSVRFPELPEGLIVRPTLRWLLESAGSGEVETELSYLTRGIGWEASYVAVVSPGDDQLGLSGWVRIDNRSGATYEDAKLKLMAGDVRIEQPGRPRFKGPEMTVMADALRGFEEKPFFEYHLYTLPRPVTIRDNQTKQISLFDPVDTPAKKVFTYDPSRSADRVEVTLEFRNDAQGGLGIPLPAGKVRLYKQDTDGSLEFIGEDRIEHTPRDENVRLRTGHAFDLVVERTRTDSRKVGKHDREDSYSTELRNHKEEDVEIVVSEAFYGLWRVVEESRKGVKASATRYEWTVPVAAGGTATITCKVRYYRVRSN